MVRITDQTNTEQTENTYSKSDTLPTDQENKVYGYAIYNTDKNTLVPKLDTYDPEVFNKKEVLEHYKKVTEDKVSKDYSHLRIVEVRLANELDKKALEQVKQE